MKKFEYQIITIDAGFWSSDIDDDLLSLQLNELGTEGWEVVSAFDTNYGRGRTKSVTVILKREFA